jgi:hypothetical protein
MHHPLMVRLYANESWIANDLDYFFENIHKMDLNYEEAMFLLKHDDLELYEKFTNHFDELLVIKNLKKLGL